MLRPCCPTPRVETLVDVALGCASPPALSRRPPEPHFSAAAGRPLGNSPGLSVLALVPGGFIIVPPLVSVWNTAARVRHCRGAVDGQAGPSSLLALVLSLILNLHLVYLQTEVNALWAAARADAGDVAPPPPVASTF